VSKWGWRHDNRWLTPVLGNTTCSENQFECDEGMCVSNLHVCDGQYDCYLDPVPADELNCREYLGLGKV